MAFVDSQAEFARRVSDLGLGEQMDSILQEGIKCFADLAFAPDSELFVKDLVISILGSGSSPLRPALRRLFVESYTLAAADLKRRVWRRRVHICRQSSARSAGPTWRNVCPGSAWKANATLATNLLT